MSHLKQSENSHLPAQAGGAGKIFISLLSVLMLGALFCNSVVAQTATEGTVVATVNVSNAKIVSNTGRDYKISFDISNGVGAQSQIKYSVRLTQVLNKTEPQIDEKVYDEILSLGENTSATKVVDYVIPDSISIGTYRLWVDVKNGSGLILGVVYVGEIKITSNVANTIQIIPGSCYFGKFLLSQGIVIDMADTFTVTCKVASTLTMDTILTPNFITRKNSSFGEIVSVAGGLTENITIKKGTNDIVLTLPKALNPQNYNLSFFLKSADSEIISNTISFNYVIPGQNGTIQNVVFDKTSYRTGDTANLQIFATQMGEGAGTITAIISNGRDSNCSATSSKEMSGESVINLPIPIIKNCTDPQANIVLSSNGTVLDSNVFRIITPVNVKMTLIKNMIILVCILIILALVSGILIYKNKKKSSVITAFIFIFIFSVSFLGLSKVSLAAAPECIINSCRALPYGINYTGQCTPVVSCIPITWQSLHCGGSYGIDCPDPMPGVINTTYYGDTTVSCNSVGQNCTYAPDSCTVSTEYCDYGCSPSGTCNPVPPSAPIPSVPAPGITFFASPNPVPYHQTSTLSWSVTGNHDGGCISSGNGNTMFWNRYTTSGTFSSGILNSDTTFSLSCTGTGGTRTSYLTLPVIRPVITSFSASPNLVPYGGSTNINWAATNYAYCEYANMQYTYTTSGSPIPSGTWHYTSSGSFSSGNLTMNTTFALFCAGNGRSPLAWTTVSVTPQTCTSWTYSPWGVCLSNNTQERTASNPLPAGCSGGTPVLSQTCPVCTSWTYSPWSSCSPTDGTQTRTVLSSSPSGCVDGSPILTQSCTPNAPDIIINATPSAVATGHSSTISWSSTGANSCTVTKNGASFATGVSGTKSSGNLNSDTTFIANCVNNGNSATKSKTVTILPAPNTSLISNPSEIVWEDVTPGDTCTLTDEDGTIISTETSGSYYVEDLPAGVQFTLVCTGPGGSASKTVTSKAPAIRSICSSSQSGNTTKDLYVNRNTTWQIKLINAFGATVTNTEWSGTDLSKTNTDKSLTLSKIYTTVGPKNVNAITTGNRSDGLSFKSVCSTTTTMKLDPGTNEEI